MKLEEYKAKKKYEEAALKRKLGIKKDDKLSAGDMIAKMNDKKRTAIMGMV